VSSSCARARGERPFERGGPSARRLDPRRAADQPEWNRYSLAWLEPHSTNGRGPAAALRDASVSTRRRPGLPLDEYVKLVLTPLAEELEARPELALARRAGVVRWYPSIRVAVHGPHRPSNRGSSGSSHTIRFPGDFDLSRAPGSDRAHGRPRPLQQALFRGARTRPGSEARRRDQRLADVRPAPRRVVTARGRGSPSETRGLDVSRSEPREQAGVAGLIEAVASPAQ